MASSLLTSTTIIFFLLCLSILFCNLSAKHGYSSHHRRHRGRGHASSSGPRLRQAYVALQAWKKVIYSDPRNFTANWVGVNVCSYNGVYCAPGLDDPKTKVVAGIDLNRADIAGFIPPEIGLLTDLALIHLNSNRFCGIIPQSISNLSLLFELDLSNNRFVGPFPTPVLSLPKLGYLDLRYNEFEGSLPAELFQKMQLDAIFVNNNRFTNVIPPFQGGTSASVIVIANNKLRGCLPPSISSSANTLEELLLINTSLSGCLPPEVGYLYKLTVLDLSYNNIVGPIPYSLAGLAHLEQLNLAHNMMTGIVPDGVCILPSLLNFTFSYNYFCEEVGICMNLTSKGVVYDDRRNCLPDKPLQRSPKECSPVIEHPVDCFLQCCEDGRANTSGNGVFGSGGSSFGPVMAPSFAPLLSPAIAPSPS